ncbi:YbjN domain-containing protein [Stakelama saccharophila]|uniref:YbjN domain-containing protein n=1 Tax=Stakelama saccharophila TaxID=3075605 RepID=A0ABZ0BCU4_9SPHN|nr:YbjN domain-containing protein [Stakelama sp. W311]WNO55007.1 YbjN domain-containing protein [Stakelama sp. W311]
MKAAILAVALTFSASISTASAQNASRSPAPATATKPSLALIHNITADPQAISEILRADGYDAEIEYSASGDPFITSEGSKNRFTIFFNNCTDGKDCRTIQFYAGFATSEPRTLSLINQWNREKRFAKAYIDDQNDPRLEMDLNLNNGGVARNNFVSDFRLWVRLLDAFKSHIDWNEDE